MLVMNWNEHFTVTLMGCVNWSSYNLYCTVLKGCSHSLISLTELSCLLHVKYTLLYRIVFVGGHAGPTNWHWLIASFLCACACACSHSSADLSATMFIYILADLSSWRFFAVREFRSGSESSFQQLGNPKVSCILITPDSLFGNLKLVYAGLWFIPT